jgi:hypothetical protein
MQASGDKGTSQLVVRLFEFLNAFFGGHESVVPNCAICSQCESLHTPVELCDRRRLKDDVRLRAEREAVLVF